MEAKLEEKKVLKDPEVMTYNRNDLELDTVFTGGTSVVVSDRNLKENVRPVDAEQVLETLLRL